MTISPQPPVRYRVSSPLQAVKLAPHPGSRLRDPTTVLVEIPPDSLLEPEGQAGSSGLINVLWNGDAFSVLYEDLKEKAEILIS